MHFPIRNFFSFQLESETNEMVRGEILKTISEQQKKARKMIEDGQARNQVRKDVDPEAILYKF